MTKLRGPDGRLLHAWREEHPGARALLDDYASMARAALALFEASGEPADLEAARRLASEAIDLFGDGAGGFLPHCQGRRRRARRAPAPGA